MTQTMNLEYTISSGTDPVSGLEYVGQTWVGEEVEITIEGIESDSATMNVVAAVHEVEALDALIEMLAGRRADLARARAIANR